MSIDRILMGVLLLWMVTILALSPALGSLSYFDTYRLLQSFLLCALGLLLGYRLLSTSQLPVRAEAHSLFALLVIIFGLGLASCLQASNTMFALMYWSHFLLLTVLAFAIQGLLKTNDAYWLIYVLVGAHCVLILRSALNVVFALVNGDVISPWLVYSGFGNIRFFNQVQVFVLPILLLLMVSRVYARVAACFLLLNLILMFVGEGLGILLVWLFILGAVAFIPFYRKLVFKGVFLSVAAYLCYLMLKFYSNFGMESDGRLISLDSGGRVELWTAALNQLDWHHLLFGYGPGMFVGKVGAVVLSHPHNSLIELVLEWSLIVALLVCVLVIKTLQVTVQTISRGDGNPLFISVGLSWFSGIAYSLASGVIVMPVPQTLLFMMWGVLLLLLGSTVGLKVTQDSSDGERYSFTALNALKVAGLLLIALSVGYLYLVLESFLHINPQAPAFQGPRFWISGLKYFE